MRKVWRPYSVLAAGLIVFLLAIPSEGVAGDRPIIGETITRSQLPDGLQQLVTDQAILAANNPIFASPRDEWGSDADFVSQIDYQLRFRARVDFMSDDYEYLAGLLLRRPQNMGIEELGLYMSAAEVTEMKRRDALGDRMEAVVELVSGIQEENIEEGVIPDYGPNFAGIWQDQLDGGRIVLAVVDASRLDLLAIHRALGGSENLKIIEQSFSYNEIEDYRLQLEAELDRLGLARDIAAVRTDQGRLLEVRVSDPALLPASFGSSVPRGAFQVVQGEPVFPAGAPNTTHSFADQQPGLRIVTFETGSPNGDVCTWGFNGHTNSYNYIVSAGHCMPGTYNNTSGSWVNLDVFQNGSSSRNLTPGSAFLRSIDDSTYDVSRISSLYADDNCYHGDNDQSSPHCKWPMASRALHNSWEVGSDRTCASLGNSGDYRCGYIEEENANGGNRVRVGMTVIGGDSGSGMKWEYRIDGILTDRSSTDAFFQTAYHVQKALGNGYFYFNCYSPGKKVNTDPANWGVCPATNA